MFTIVENIPENDLLSIFIEIDICLEASYYLISKRGFWKMSSPRPHKGVHFQTKPFQSYHIVYRRPPYQLEPP